MATVMRHHRLPCAGALALVATLAVAPASAQGLTGGTNVYGWPLDPVVTPLTERVEWVSSWQPGKPHRSESGRGTVFYGSGAASGRWTDEMALSPDGNRALRGTYDDVSMVSIPEGKQLWSRGMRDTTALAFSPDGRTFVRVSDYGGAWLHDAASGQALATWSDDEENGFERAVFSPDGRLAALAASSSAEVWIVDVGSGETRATLGGTGWLTTLAFSADGKRLLAFGSSELRVWDVGSGRVLFYEKDWRWNACFVDGDLSVAWLGGDKGRLERLELRRDGAPPAGPVAGAPAQWGRARPGDPQRVVIHHDRPYTSVIDVAAGQETHRLEGRGDLLLSADGRRLLVAGDGSWGVWDAASMEPQRVGAFHRGGITALAQSGRLLASGDETGTVLVRDRNSGVVKAHLFGHLEEVTGLAFAPPGSPLDGHLLVGGYHGAWLFELASGEVRHHFPFPERGLAVALSPDGGALILSAWDDDCSSCGQGEIWDTATMERRHHFEGVGWRRFAFARGGTLMVTGGYGTPVQVVDLESGRVLRWTTSGGRDELYDVAVLEDRYIVVASDNDGYHHLWTPGMADELDLDTCDILSAAPGGRLLIAGDCEDGFVVMDTASGAEVGQVRGPRLGDDDWIGVQGFSADGQRLLLGYGSGRIMTHEMGSYRTSGGGSRLAGTPLPGSTAPNLMDLQQIAAGGSGKVIERYKPLAHHTVEPSVEQLAVSADGNHVAVAPSADGAAVVYRCADGQQVRSSSIDWETRVGHVGFDGDGRLVISASYGGKSQIHDIEANQVLQSFDDDCGRAFVRPDGAVVCAGPKMRLLRDGEEVASLRKYLGTHDTVATPDAAVIAISHYREIKLYDVAGDSLTHRLDLAGHWTGIHSLGLSADGTRVASAGSGVALLHDGHSGALLQVFDGAPDGVKHVALSPDGRRLATSGSQGAVWIWDTSNGQPLASLSADFPVAGALAFTPDGDGLITLGEDGHLAHWDIRGI